LWQELQSLNLEVNHVTFTILVRAASAAGDKAQVPS
jgi:hypothetical protein